jgi:hypothetical protein
MYVRATEPVGESGKSGKLIASVEKAACSHLGAFRVVIDYDSTNITATNFEFKATCAKHRNK